VRAPIPCPAGLILLPAERKLFTVANSRQRTRRDPQIDEITLYARCPFSSQCEVILAGSTLVTVPFNLNAALRIRFEPCGVTFKDLPHIRAKIVTIEIKVDVSKRTFFSTFA
jgi:hypothetical protein